MDDHSEPSILLVSGSAGTAGRHPAMTGLCLGVKGSPVQIRPSRRRARPADHGERRGQRAFLCQSLSRLVSLDKPELGTIWGPLGSRRAVFKRKVGAQRGPSVRDGLGVWMQVALGGDQRSVPGDLPEHVDRDTGIGHPGKAGVAQAVTAQVLVPEPCHDLVPVSRVPEDGRGDPAAARACEDARRGVMANGIEALLDERTDFFNQGDGAGPLAFCALVDESTGAWCCLPTDRPGPGVAVDVGADP
jgi:hypothetical protein